MDLSPASTVLVRFPFSDVASTKQRPALVLAHVTKRRAVDLVVVSMITSRIESATLAGDVVLADWQSAGLLHESKVRLAKIATVDANLVRRQLGGLSRRDLARLRKAFRDVFGALLTTR